MPLLKADAKIIRKRKGVKLKEQLLVTIFFLFCTIGIVFLAALRLGFFKINQIEVTGTRRVSGKEILKRSGLRLGESMIFFEDILRREILKNPWIGNADIKRDFILQKVQIEIEEVEPFCLVLGKENQLYYISKTGKRLGKANFNEGLDFPVLIGEGIWQTKFVEGALKILALSLESNVLNWKQISEINVGSIYGITVFTTDGREINFGVSDLQEKWYKVERIITHTRKFNLTEKYINISSGKLGVVNFNL